ncbi:hypothetical protein BS47DRAFT_475768 [Hydnum rufescens UP504]|uniref:Uncharacterized protein n=1 Tax=Hydnum rufescens UP504 TaxID=1448309 RepID=A0A9P6B5D4_9AGAM|nr:hypothetical protein BS47DRAFT_475768 [Hydnum rufescens UP504]
MASVLSQDILKATDGPLGITSHGEGGVSSTASVLQGELASDTPLSRIRRKLAQLETSLPENKPLPEAALLKVLPSSPNPPPPLEERAAGECRASTPHSRCKNGGKGGRSNHGHQPLPLSKGRHKSSSTAASSPPLQQPPAASATPLQAPSNPCQCPWYVSPRSCRSRIFNSSGFFQTVDGYLVVLTTCVAIAH